MKHIKRKIMALLLCLSLTTNQAFAVPVAIPVIVGGVAVVAAVAVMLGYQTTDSNDFYEIYDTIVDKAEINRAKAVSAYVLSSVLVNQVQQGIDKVTTGIKNKIWQFPKKYTSETKNDAMPLTISRSVSLLGNTNTVSGRIYSAGYGFTSLENFCKTIDSDGFYYSNLLKIGQNYYRYRINSYKDQVLLQYSSDKVNWKSAKRTSTSQNLAFSMSDLGSQNTNNKMYIKLSVDNNYLLKLSCLYYNAADNYTRLDEKFVADESFNQITVSNDATLVSHTNADVPVNQLPVDASKTYGKTIDGTKSYTEADVVYAASDVKITDLTSIDPIVKNPSTGGNTGGTDMSLWDWLKAGIATIIEKLTAIPTAVTNIGINITNAVNALPTAISNIGTNIVNAVNAIPSAVHSIGNDIVGKLNDIPESIASSIAGALDGVANLSMNLNNDLKQLFIPDPTLLQQKYNKLSFDFTNKLGVIRQSFDLMFALVAQDFEVKQPSLKITLYPPYGDGSTVELIDWSFFNQYWTTYQNIASAIVWFLFFRKVVINSNEYFGGGK